MPKYADELPVKDLVTTPISSYDSTKLNVPDLAGKFNFSANYWDNFVGPNPVACMKPSDQVIAVPPQSIYVYPYSATEYWVFYLDNITAAATRRVACFKFNPVTTTHLWQGAITLAFPVAGNQTARGMSLMLDTQSTGTVSATGTTVTGTGTTWATDKVPVGARIGIGSTDPAQITTWAQVTAVNDTSITLGSTLGTIAGGTPYVIEYMTIAIVTTNATATNGGLFLVKGLNIDTFTAAGPTIPAATTVDNIRAVYWIKDAATVTNTVAGGISQDTKISNSEQYVYVTDGSASTLKVYRYNTRMALSLTAGAHTATGSDIVATGNNTVVGTISQNSNNVLVTANHGPGSGVKSLYVVTANTPARAYRIPVSTITNGATNLVASGGSMIENPPGGTATHSTTNSFTDIAYDSVTDRFFITAQARIYCTQYNESNAQFDMAGNIASYQLDQASSQGVPFLHSLNSGPMSLQCINGYMFVAQQVTSTTGGAIYAVPIGMDYTFGSSDSRKIIFPKILTGTTRKFVSIHTDDVKQIPAGTYGKTLEPYRLVYRTSGIDDNSGSWLSVPDDGTISGAAAANSIQFAAEFRILGDLNIPARITKLILITQGDNRIPAEYYWDYSKFDSAIGTVAFIQNQLLASLSTHTINLYNADNMALLLTQDSDSTTNGVFEYWNGSAWVAGLGTNTVGVSRRFRPTASLPSNTNILPELLI